MPSHEFECRHAVGGEGCELRDPGAKCLKPLRAHLLGRALRDHQPALPMLAAIDAHEQGAGREAARRAAWVGVAAGQAEPQHVHGRADIDRTQPRPRPHRRTAPIRPHHQIGANNERAVRRADMHARDPAGILDQLRDLGLHPQAEPGVPPAFPGEEIQEIPLRHEHDAAGSRRQMREIGDRKHLVADLGRKRGLGLMRQAQERVEQPEFVQHLQGRGVDRVAAEVAQEIGVLFQHQHIDSGAGQQIAQHHPGWPASGDAAADGDLGRRHRAFSPSAAPRSADRALAPAAPPGISASPSPPASRPAPPRPRPASS